MCINETGFYIDTPSVYLPIFYFNFSLLQILYTIHPNIFIAIV